MARRIKYTTTGARDLGQHEHHLNKKGGEKGKKQWKYIRSSIKELKATPCRWKVSDDYPGARERVVDEYVIVYEVENDTGDNDTAGDIVTIMRIIAPGQLRNP